MRPQKQNRDLATKRLMFAEEIRGRNRHAILKEMRQSF